MYTNLQQKHEHGFNLPPSPPLWTLLKKSVIFVGEVFPCFILNIAQTVSTSAVLIEHTLISSHFETVRTSVSTALGRAGYLKNNKHLVSQVELKSHVFALCRSLFVDNFNMFGRFNVLLAMHVWLIYIRTQLTKATLANRTTAQRSPDDHPRDILWRQVGHEWCVRSLSRLT